MKLKLPDSAYNWISLSGAVVAVISLFMIVFLFVITSLFESGGSYIGLVIYIVLPAFFVAGLILIPIGMLINFKRSPDRKDKKRLFIDLNLASHRNASLIFITGTIIFLFISALGSYEAFHYTESTEFCGTLCHSVMEPEYTAYLNSPHARVRCVECHVGSGADWYVKSKMAGLYQVYAITANVYPRPIPTPISNLRPARETCEECHWPQKFYPQKLRLEKHYLLDENNTEWNISLIMRIGASHSSKGLSEGIHWHINPDVKVEFVSFDNKEQTIPWVKYTNTKTGEEKIFIDEESNFDISMLDTLTVRKMDCIDCHNRPSHIYNPPATFVNYAISTGEIPQELPEIKNLSMEICSEDFKTMDSAKAHIAKSIKEFYEENYFDLYENNFPLIEKAITGLQNEYAKNIFPEMKVKWDQYPNNIGHLNYDGCFRCHTESHVSDEGLSISRDCNVCHLINAQGPADNLQVAVYNEFLEFNHPDGDDSWKEALCTDCHTGLNP